MSQKKSCRKSATLERVGNVEKFGGKVVQKKQPVADMGFTAYFKDTVGNIETNRF